MRRATRSTRVTRTANRRSTDVDALPSGFSAESVKLCTSTRHPGQPMAFELAWNGSRRSLDQTYDVVSHYKDAAPRPSQQDPAGVSL